MQATIDYDALFKEFISEFFQDFVAFANPALHKAIDWSRGYEFLEQEMINALKGKFRQKGSRRETDKLVKVFLKSGDMHFIFIHLEIQHKPNPDFPSRMMIYRAFIQLKYGKDDISAYAVFTGNPPPKSHLRYYKETFGTSLEYRFISLVAANIGEARLRKANQNVFAMAILAAKYVHQSKGNPTLRLKLKSKLLRCMKRGKIPLEKFVQLLIFVRDLVDLPMPLEEEYLKFQHALFFSNEDAMTVTEGTKQMAIGFYERAFGIQPQVVIDQLQSEMKELVKKNAKTEKQIAKVEQEKARIEQEKARIELERAVAEQERVRAEQEKVRAEQERSIQLANTIQNLHQKAKMDAAQIAVIVEMNEEEVAAILAGIVDDEAK